MAISSQTLDILGERQAGQDVRTQNGTRLLSLSLSLKKFVRITFIFFQVLTEACFVSFICVYIVMACQAVANIVKSSLGPVGLDKVFFISVNTAKGAI